MKPIPLAIVEDDPIIRESLRTFLGGDPQFDLLYTAVSIEDFLQALETDARIVPAVILLDIQLPGMSGIEGIPSIKKLRPGVDVIMLTTFEESDKIFAALCAGACSYLSKRVSLVTIRDAILTVHRGGSYMSPSIARKVVEHFIPAPKKDDGPLTQRQQEIVDCIVNGLSYKMTADKLGISLDTVRTHIKHIYQVLEINSKGELIRKTFDKK
ncbi:MAG: response regulator transcription factor [Saprospiraceae bacterium]|nr:response regulator transcription factor [Candidatus Opimibacter skivensis]MBP8086035.1 response regulator transcription factor [Saprospiraceae bacterium]